MKTLCEEVIDMFRELRDSWRPRGRADIRPAYPPYETPPPPEAPPPPELPPEDLRLEALAREFRTELFAKLLLELPFHRDRMIESFVIGDTRQLRNSVHQILGAAAYCGEEELELGLRQLRLALKTDNSDTITHYYHRAIRAINYTLRESGGRRVPSDVPAASDPSSPRPPRPDR